MHALFDNLAYQDQVFREDWDMQHVLEIGLFVFIPEWDIFDMSNGVSRVVPSFDIVGTIGLS